MNFYRRCLPTKLRTHVMNYGMKLSVKDLGYPFCKIDNSELLILSSVSF